MFVETCLIGCDSMILVFRTNFDFDYCFCLGKKFQFKKIVYERQRERGWDRLLFGLLHFRDEIKIANPFVHESR